MKLRQNPDAILILISEECTRRQVTPDEVQNGGRRTITNEARAAIAYRAVTELGLPAAEIARHLGVTTSLILRAVEKMDRRRED